jgi:hypothetical protein
MEDQMNLPNLGDPPPSRHKIKKKYRRLAEDASRPRRSKLAKKMARELKEKNEEDGREVSPAPLINDVLA